MNKIFAKDVLNKIKKILETGGIEEAKVEAKLILMEVSGLCYEKIIVGEVISEKIQNKAIEIAEKRVQTGAPVQHLLGCAQFMGLKFKVSSDVLIPRDETEILVLEGKKIIEKMHKQKVKVLDIGTGSGIIPIVLGKIFGNKVEALGIDISIKALSIAIENSQKYLPSNIAIFRKSDLFSNIHEGEIFDVIISNPPYIPLNVKETMQKEVLNFEPDSALFTEDALGVEFYEKIILNSKLHIKKGGYVLFELGINQANLVEKMFKQEGFCDIKIVDDLAGIHRVICAKLNV